MTTECQHVPDSEDATICGLCGDEEVFAIDYERLVGFVRHIAECGTENALIHQQRAVRVLDAVGEFTRPINGPEPVGEKR